MDTSWLRRVFGTYGFEIDETGEDDVENLKILHKLFYEFSHSMIGLNGCMRIV